MEAGAQVQEDGRALVALRADERDRVVLLPVRGGAQRDGAELEARLSQEGHVTVRFSPAARGRVPARHTPGEMNGAEANFYQQLELRRLAGEFCAIHFEQVTLKLGKDLRYTPDFFVVDKDGFISCYEVKGFFRDDSRVKILTAAQAFPYFAFYLARKQRGAWVVEEV
jgi:hypothetical protein